MHQDSRAPLVLLTDFGTRDWFVGVMKGVIAGIAPGQTVIDLGHEISPGDVRAAAFTLRAAAPHFPAGSVFCCVVDPGVGTDRAVLIAESRSQVFVGPDNGLFAELPGARYYRFDPEAHPELLYPGGSATFHGRDIFAPLAAHLARGTRPETIAAALGSPDPQATVIRLPEVPAFASGSGSANDGRQLTGVIEYIDRFGNCITSIAGAGNALNPPPPWAVHAADRLLFQTDGLAVSYGARTPGEALVYAGSTGALEIAVNQASAAEQFALRTGMPISISTRAEADKQQEQGAPA